MKYIIVFLISISILLSHSSSMAQDTSDSMTFTIIVGVPDQSIEESKEQTLLGLNDVSAHENEGTLTFTVSLSAQSTQPVSVAYATKPETAEPGSDYTDAASTLMIQPGSLSAEIAIKLMDDHLHEGDETFVVTLSQPQNATLRNSQATGTILDDEELPVLTIEDATAEEITQKMTFTLNLSSPSSQDVSVVYKTVDDTAIADLDYTAAEGTLVIPAGKDSGSIEVAITLDELRDEGDETFFVALSNPINAVLQNEQVTGTIQNTSGSFINRALGRPLPEPSTYMLFLLGLMGLGWLARRRR